MTAIPPHILVTADHDLRAEGIGHILEPQFHVVGVAADDQELVRMAADLQPDLILSDTSMPGVDGLEALRRIRRKDPEAKVLLVSSQFDATSINRAFATGAADYLTKNAASWEVSFAVSEVLKGRRYISPEATAVMLVPQRPARYGASTKDAEGPTRILVADDHPAVRMGLRLQLSADPGIAGVGEAADGRGVVVEAQRLAPDVVLLD